MGLDQAIRAVAGYPLVMARLASSPVRAVLPRREADSTSHPAFKCPGCGYELRVAPRSAKYACPRCAVALGPRKAGTAASLTAGRRSRPVA
jgi:predicted RNA-binding Zn-ribbon protein involved in translation (DUF1610 family)